MFSDTFESFNTQYELEPLEVDLPLSIPRYVEDGYSFVVIAAIIEDNGMESWHVIFHSETQAHGEALMNVDEILIDGEEAMEEGYHELAVDEVMEIFEPSTGIIGHKLSFSTDYTEAPKFTNMKAVPV